MYMTLLKWEDFTLSAENDQIQIDNHFNLFF